MSLQKYNKKPSVSIFLFYNEIDRSQIAQFAVKFS